MVGEMTFELSGAGALDYLNCGYGQKRLQFRGPEQKLDAPYAAFIGGTETYGKFVARPFPALVEDMTGLAAVNLGVVNAGIETFRSDLTVLNIARGAEFVVLQVMGPEYVSNRYFSVHPRRNDRFIRAAPQLQQLYPRVDFTEIHFVGHLLHRLRRESVRNFRKVISECRLEWLISCVSLVRRIGRPTVLLWLSRKSGHASGPDEFVTAQLLAPLEKRCLSVIQVLPDAHVLAEGTNGMVFGQMEAFAAMDLPNVAMHARVATALYDGLRRVHLV
jgi:hypothetical protein